MNAYLRQAASAGCASVLILGAGTAWAECSPENWQDCAGKPWVDGDKMETPLGERWWPNELWGEGTTSFSPPRSAR